MRKRRVVGLLMAVLMLGACAPADLDAAPGPPGPIDQAAVEREADSVRTATATAPLRDLSCEEMASALRDDPRAGLEPLAERCFVVSAVADAETAADDAAGWVHRLPAGFAADPERVSPGGPAMVATRELYTDVAVATVTTVPDMLFPDFDPATKRRPAGQDTWVVVEVYALRG